MATHPVFDMIQVPVLCHALSATAAEARRSPLGDIHLVVDDETGLIYNHDFDEELAAYSVAYDNSLHHSPVFRQFAEGLARDLIERYDLHDKRIVEIGSGSADFLNLLCEMGPNTGTGYDPSHDPRRTMDGRSERLTIVQDYYPTEQPIDADLVVCQHVLEHVPDPDALLAGVRRSLPGPDTGVYFEVPDATYMIEAGSYWDVLYEHRSYYAEGVLRDAFARAGMEVTGSGRAFSDQFLWVEGRAGSGPGSTTGSVTASVAGAQPASTTDVPKLVQAAIEFGQAFDAVRAEWTGRLAEMTADGPVAMWGAGTKGIMFLNSVDGAEGIAQLVDLNPNKHGLHVPGTAQQIVAPEDLASPAHVIVTNPIYAAEIEATVRELGHDATIHSLV